MLTAPKDNNKPVQGLGVGSMIQFSNPARYGVIKVINKDPNSHKEYAELETVSMHKLIAINNLLCSCIIIISSLLHAHNVY